MSANDKAIEVEQVFARLKERTADLQAAVRLFLDLKQAQPLVGEIAGDEHFEACEVAELLLRDACAAFRDTAAEHDMALMDLDA